MIGPVFMCETSKPSSSSLLTAWQDSLSCALITATNPAPCSTPVYLGGDNTDRQQTNDVYQLDLQFMYPDYLNGDLTVISCSAYQGSYKVAVTFKNSIRNLDIEIETRDPINLSSLDSMTIPFSPSVQMGQTDASSPLWTEEALSTYSQMNLISIVKALNSPLSGNVTVFGVAPTANDGTMSFDSALNIATTTISSVADLQYNLDPALVESMLRNLTVSLMSTKTWTTTAPVNQSVTELSYSFARRHNSSFRISVPWAWL
jgi:hypothetical protein